MAKGTKKGLIIMAKEPLAGRVKTRLCPPYSSEEAAQLYQCFLLDTFELAARLQGVTATVAYFPSEAEKTFKSMVPSTFELTPQRGNNLGERLSNAFEQLFSLGYEQVVAIGADSPTLPLVYMRRSFELLPRADLVLGPSTDGGYYLIGMKAPHRDLFVGVTMGTDKVLLQTLERASQAKLRVSLLPPWYDIDAADDLKRLAAELRVVPDDVAVHTRTFLSMQRML